jgi:hypothetical protein
VINIIRYDIGPVPQKSLLESNDKGARHTEVFLTAAILVAQVILREKDDPASILKISRPQGFTSFTTSSQLFFAFFTAMTADS